VRSVEIGLIDTTGTVDPKKLSAAVAALNIQMTQHLRQYWSIAPAATVRLLANDEPIPLGVWPIRLVKELKLKEGGFHTTTHSNQPYAKVVVTQRNDDWTIEASHEALEMLVDPGGNRLQVAQAINLNGQQIYDDTGEFEYLVEICDPCESFAYQIGGIKVSDFILPDFYDTTGFSAGRYSFAGNIKAPRQILPGGYITWIHPKTSEIRQMIWLNPKGHPTVRSVGHITGSSIRMHVDSDTRCRMRAASAKWPFKFEILPASDPNARNDRFKSEPDHWVTYNEDGEIEIEEFDDKGHLVGTSQEKVKKGKPIFRKAGTHHRVKNLGNVKLTGGKDLIDPTTLIPKRSA
jgi:hypothetical protein